MLTPGVPIMERLALHLLEHLKQQQLAERLPRQLEVMVPGPY